jgi:DNA repair exonuclease SbcCD ATPase subunit
LREADSAVDEARKRARDMAVESDERLASTRTAIQEARDEADAYRTELVKRTEERVGTVDAAVKDVDRRVKEFVTQTKLFDRAEELRAELERRMEDLGSDLERLDQRRSETAELEAQFVKIKRLEDEVNSKMTRFLSEKRRIELMESDFKRLLQTAQSVDDKLAQVTASDDTLQSLQAQLRRLEDAVGEAETKYERLEKKNQILDATADGIDRNFQALREADANAKRFDEELRRLGEGILSAKTGIDRLLEGKDRTDEVAEKMGSLDTVLSDIEKRMDVMQKAREWLARTETRLEEVTKQAQEQVKIMGTLLKAEGAKGTKDRGGAPPIGVRETVVKLAHQGWSIDEISRAVKLSKGEVELILEISPKG